MTSKRLLGTLLHGAAIIAAAVLTGPATAATARPHHKAVIHHRLARGGGSDGASSHPRRRYGAAPPLASSEGPGYAGSTYEGPGAEVFRQTVRAAHAPGLTSEIDPDAKQSATGGPSGGLPSNSNGP